MGTPTINCIIVDDEPLSANLLESYVSRCENTHLLEKFNNPIKALHYLETCKPDVIFLDVQMPELNGIQFMNILNKNCLVVLTTAYPEYAINAFDFDVVDYLLKPIPFERFILAVNKVKEKLDNSYSKIELNENAPHIFIKSEHKYIKIFCQEIIYLEGLRDYVAIHTKERKYLTLQSMKSFESILSKNFTRVHKSYIINTNKITSISKNLVVIDTKQIPIGAVYSQNLHQIFKFLGV